MDLNLYCSIISAIDTKKKFFEEIKSIMTEIDFSEEVFFKDQIFLGNGESSEIVEMMLYFLIKKALIIISGMQQFVPCTSTIDREEHGREIEEEKNKLKKIVQQINIALLGDEK